MAQEVREHAFDGTRTAERVTGEKIALIVSDDLFALRPSEIVAGIDNPERSSRGLPTPEDRHRPLAWSPLWVPT